MESIPLLELVGCAGSEKSVVILDPAQTGCVLDRRVAEILCTQDAKKVSRRGTILFYGTFISSGGWAVVCKQKVSRVPRRDCLLLRGDHRIPILQDRALALRSGDAMLVGSGKSVVKIALRLRYRESAARYLWHFGLSRCLSPQPRSICSVSSRLRMMALPGSYVGILHASRLASMQLMSDEQQTDSSVEHHGSTLACSSSCLPTVRMIASGTAAASNLDNAGFYSMCGLDGIALAALADLDVAAATPGCDAIPTFHTGYSPGEVQTAAIDAQGSQRSRNSATHPRMRADLLDWPVAMSPLDQGLLPAASSADSMSIPGTTGSGPYAAGKDRSASVPRRAPSRLMYRIIAPGYAHARSSRLFVSSFTGPTPEQLGNSAFAASAAGTAAGDSHGYWLLGFPHDAVLDYCVAYQRLRRLLQAGCGNAAPESRTGASKCSIACFDASIAEAAPGSARSGGMRSKSFSSASSSADASQDGCSVEVTLSELGNRLSSWVSSTAPPPSASASRRQPVHAGSERSGRLYLRVFASTSAGNALKSLQDMRTVGCICDDSAQFGGFPLDFYTLAQGKPYRAYRFHVIGGELEECASKRREAVRQPVFKPLLRASMRDGRLVFQGTGGSPELEDSSAAAAGVTEKQAMSPITSAGQNTSTKHLEVGSKRPRDAAASSTCPAPPKTEEAEGKRRRVSGGSASNIVQVDSAYICYQLTGVTLTRRGEKTFQFVGGRQVPSLYPYIESTPKFRYSGSVLWQGPASIGIWDPYPKARMHLLFLPAPGTLQLASSSTQAGHKKQMTLDGAQLRDPSVSESHNTVRSIGDLTWVKHGDALARFHAESQAVAQQLLGYLQEATTGSTRFGPLRLCYHIVPSLRPLHLHAITMDMSSDCCKTRRHLQSFLSEAAMDPAELEARLQASPTAALDPGWCRARYDAGMRATITCKLCGSGHDGLASFKRHQQTCLGGVKAPASSAEQQASGGGR